MLLAAAATAPHCYGHSPLGGSSWNSSVGRQGTNERKSEQLLQQAPTSLNFSFFFYKRKLRWETIIN